MDVLSALTAVALAGSVEPLVQVPPVAEGQGVVLLIDARVEGGIVIDACASVEIERKTASGWEGLTSPPCDASLASTSVAATLTITLPPLPPGEYRAGLSWGAGCLAGVPFELAGCTTLGAVWSEAFRVGSAPP